MVDDYFSGIEALIEQQEKSLANFQKGLADINEIIRQVSRESGVVGLIETAHLLGTAVRRAAVLEAINTIKPQLVPLLKTAFFQAAVNTEEYNYDLYIRQLDAAIEANQDDLFYVDTAKFILLEAGFKLKLEFLGTIEQWADAVKATRNILNLGRTRGITISKKGEKKEELSSRIWREKLYGASREGRTITRYSKRQERDIDLTGRYKRQYRNTIATRLSLVPPNQAPFWYLIEHGNKNVKGPFSGEFEPYPEVAPQRVREQFEQLINTTLEREIRRYYREIEDIAGLYEFRDGVSRPKSDEEIVEEKINEVIDDYIIKGEEIERTTIEQVATGLREGQKRTGQTLATQKVFVDEVEKRVEFYKSKGGRVLPRVREASGRFGRILKEGQ